jgi:hypothetical protein
MGFTPNISISVVVNSNPASGMGAVWLRTLKVGFRDRKDTDRYDFTSWVIHED